MQFREIGNTGIQASVVGLGCEHLDNQPPELAQEVVDAALDGGVNLLDVFMPGEEVRKNIGRALAGRRDKVVIQGAIGSVDLKQQYDMSRDLDVCRRYFEDLLRFLGTDYVDFGLLFFMDSHEDIDAMLNNGVVDYARQLKKEGKIRAVGASVHNPATARRLVEEGLVEMMLFSVNPAFDMIPGVGDIATMLENPLDGQVTRTDPERAELYRLCQSRGVGITAMKPLGAGKLLSTDHSPFTQAMTPVQCIHYALTRPAVASAVVGCRSREQMAAALAYLDATDGERDFSAVVGSLRSDAREGFRGSCLYCNHCLPCPADIDIAAVNKYLDIALLDADRVPPSVVQHYKALSSHGGDCVACGSCEERCPFDVSVVSNMKKAAEVFGM